MDNQSGSDPNTNGDGFLSMEMNDDLDGNGTTKDSFPCSNQSEVRSICMVFVGCSLLMFWYFVICDVGE